MYVCRNQKTLFKRWSPVSTTSICNIMTPSTNEPKETAETIMIFFCFIWPFVWSLDRERRNATRAVLMIIKKGRKRRSRIKSKTHNRYGLRTKYCTLKPATDCLPCPPRRSVCEKHRYVVSFHVGARHHYFAPSCTRWSSMCAPHRVVLVSCQIALLIELLYWKLPYTIILRT